MADTGPAVVTVMFGLNDMTRVPLDEYWAMPEAQRHEVARDVVRGLYRELVEECRRRKVLPVWVYLPMPGVVDVRVRSDVLVTSRNDWLGIQSSAVPSTSTLSR